MKTTDSLAQKVRKIKRYLLDGNSLTVQDCNKMFGTHTLVQRVAEFRNKENLPILDKWETSPSGSRYKRYWLDLPEYYRLQEEKHSKQLLKEK